LKILLHKKSLTAFLDFRKSKTSENGLWKKIEKEESGKEQEYLKLKKSKPMNEKSQMGIGQL
jgi:hypothetical protein